MTVKVRTVTKIMILNQDDDTVDNDDDDNDSCSVNVMPNQK